MELRCKLSFRRIDANNVSKADSKEGSGRVGRDPGILGPKYQNRCEAQARLPVAKWGKRKEIHRVGDQPRRNLG